MLASGYNTSVQTNNVIPIQHGKYVTFHFGLNWNLALDLQSHIVPFSCNKCWTEQRKFAIEHSNYDYDFSALKGQHCISIK